MFVKTTRRGYHLRHGHQYAAGYFLLLTLPEERDAEWLAERERVMQVAIPKTLALGRPAWEWQYRLKELGLDPQYGEVTYHPPITDMRGFIRFAWLRQSGHWMVGRCSVGECLDIPLSGSYGADGLPRDLPRATWEQGIQLPAELCHAWNNGGGHNSSGSEGPSMREWATTNFGALHQAGRRQP